MYDKIRKIIKNIKSDEWRKFLELLQKLRISNRTKEYFLRLKFYTSINKNVGILENLQINRNGTPVSLSIKMKLLKKSKKSRRKCSMTMVGKLYTLTHPRIAP